jgi:hypothetical protein
LSDLERRRVDHPTATTTIGAMEGERAAPFSDVSVEGALDTKLRQSDARGRVSEDEAMGQRYRARSGQGVAISEGVSHGCTWPTQVKFSLPVGSDTTDAIQSHDGDTEGPYPRQKSAVGKQSIQKARGVECEYARRYLSPV